MKNTKQDRLKAELERAREKAAEWQAKVRDLEKQVREQENMEILREVRAIAASNCSTSVSGSRAGVSGAFSVCWASRKTAPIAIPSDTPRP